MLNVGMIMYSFLLTFTCWFENKWEFSLENVIAGEATSALMFLKDGRYVQVFRHSQVSLLSNPREC